MSFLSFFSNPITLTLAAAIAIGVIVYELVNRDEPHSYGGGRGPGSGGRGPSSGGRSHGSEGIGVVSGGKGPGSGGIEPVSGSRVPTSGSRGPASGSGSRCSKSNISSFKDIHQSIGSGSGCRCSQSSISSSEHIPQSIGPGSVCDSYCSQSSISSIEDIPSSIGPGSGSGFCCSQSNISSIEDIPSSIGPGSGSSSSCSQSSHSSFEDSTSSSELRSRNMKIKKKLSKSKAKSVAKRKLSCQSTESTLNTEFDKNNYYKNVLDKFGNDVKNLNKDDDEKKTFYKSIDEDCPANNTSVDIKGIKLINTHTSDANQGVQQNTQNDLSDRENAYNQETNPTNFNGTCSRDETVPNNTQNDSESENPLCRACEEVQANAVAYPCNHCCLCVDCASKIHRIYSKCSICEFEVEHYETLKI